MKSLLIACAVLGLATPAAAQEPADPEPIADFWTAEEEAIAAEQTAAPGAAPAPETAPAPAPAGAPASPAPVAPACDEVVVVRRALDALRVAAARPLPARRGRRLPALRVRSCVARRLRVELRARDDGALLARAEAGLVAGRTTPLSLTTTRAIERRAGRVGLVLRVRLR